MTDRPRALRLGKEALPLRPPGVLTTLETASTEMAHIGLDLETGDATEPDTECTCSDGDD